MTQYTPATLVAAAARHMITQGRPGYSVEKGACMYRAPDGTRCAIGGLLPPETPDYVLEGESLLKALSCILGQPIQSVAPKDIWDAARWIQGVHDIWAAVTLREDADVSRSQAESRLLFALAEADTAAAGWREELGDDYPKFLALIGVEEKDGGFVIRRRRSA